MATAFTKQRSTGIRNKRLRPVRRPIPIDVDNFSLKKLGKGIANVAKDVVKVSVQPIQIAKSSITGKPMDKIQFNTGLGKAVGNVQEKVNTGLNATAKTFANTITGGLASKVTNIVRKPEYKESFGNYVENKNSPEAAAIGTAVGAVGGGLAIASGVNKLAKNLKLDKQGTAALEQGAGSLLSGLTGMSANQGQPNNVVQSLGEMVSTPQPEQVYSGSGIPNPTALTAGMDNIPGGKYAIYLIVGLLFILFIASFFSHKK